MAPRFTKLPPDADPENEEIAAAMVTRHIRVPDPSEFKGYLFAEDLGDLPKRDQKTVFALSKIEQWIDWQTETIVELWQQLRKLDAEVAKRKIEQAKIKEQQKEDGWKWTLLKWGGVTAGAAFLSALFRWIMEKL